MLHSSVEGSWLLTSNSLNRERYSLGLPAVVFPVSRGGGGGGGHYICTAFNGLASPFGSYQFYHDLSIRTFAWLRPKSVYKSTFDTLKQIIPLSHGVIVLEIPSHLHHDMAYSKGTTELNFSLEGSLHSSSSHF